MQTHALVFENFDLYAVCE